MRLQRFCHGRRLDSAEFLFFRVVIDSFEYQFVFERFILFKRQFQFILRFVLSSEQQFLIWLLNPFQGRDNLGKLLLPVNRWRASSPPQHDDHLSSDKQYE